MPASDQKWQKVVRVALTSNQWTMPKSIQPKARVHLHDIWQAETKADAKAAFDFFVETYEVKYDKAVAKLVKDREELLAFYDFPAEHWKHIRTSNRGFAEWGEVFGDRAMPESW